MPEGLLQIIALLSAGYLLLILELFVPGGVLGVAGGVSILYGCYLAFGLGTGWGVTTVGVSIVVTWIIVRMFLRSRTAKNLILSEGADSWQGQDIRLVELVGKEGVTLSMLRPAGLAEIDEARVDVVADSEFIDRGVAIRVVEVEGNRVVVEALEATLGAEAELPASG